MTARLMDWGSGPARPELNRRVSVATSVGGNSQDSFVSNVVKPIIDVHSIDMAFEQVVAEKGIQPAVADSMRKLMSVDMKSGAAHAYYTDMANRGAINLAMRGGRKQLALSYALSESQMAALAAYAPEYKLSYRSRDVHDHPMAAACRLIDRDLVYGRLPLSGKVIDVGSAVVCHVTSGEFGARVHGCAPEYDPKDASRRTMDDLRVRRILERTSDIRVQASARAYLERDPAAVCGSLVQDCTAKADYMTCVHVYDVPIGDWPAIMERHGTRVVEGCLLFSPGMFEMRRGQMEVAGARYEVDPDLGIIRMGFIDSPSWWYTHDWVDYMKYGVDQVLKGDKGFYSYKIVERRGDTLFFRILPVAARPDPDFLQVYQLPGVEMVEVSGFDVGRSERQLSMRRRTYLWPYPLWQDMLTHACVMLQRGSLDCEKLFNHYRTVAPRQTVNAVCIAGGHTVDVDQLVPLVVHVALAAAMTVLKGQIETNAHISSAMLARGRITESTVYKILGAVGATIKAGFGLLCYPLILFSNFVDAKAHAMMSRGLIDWEVQTRIKTVNMKHVLSDRYVHSPVMNELQVDAVQIPFERAAPFDHVAAALKDPKLAKALLAGFFDDLPSDVLRSLEEVAGVGAVEVSVDSAGIATSVKVNEASTPLVKPPPSYKTVESLSGADVVAKRRMAIEEAILQCEYEMKAVQASLVSVWRELVPGVRPRTDLLASREEEYRFPTFWWIERGIVAHSITSPNKPVSTFEYSAVYVPIPDQDTGSYVRPVFEEEYVGPSMGEQVRRTHFKIADSEYTGWALANASVLVYNGQELIAAMRMALEKDLDFRTKLISGPPGCGKTFQICSVVTPEDVVFAPVRKVCIDTRRTIAEKSEALAAVASVRCRTTDSYLVNYTVKPFLRAMSASRLLADEAFMTHSGRWWACAALLGVKEVWFYGDPKQIPPVVRAGAPKQFVQVQDCDEHVELWVDFRNPASAVAAWGSLYDWKVRATSLERGSLLHVEKCGALPHWKNQVMLGFYQVDKREMAREYASLSPAPRMSTVHEVQGETLTSVKLHRFDRRRRNDNMALFDQEAYVLVAMSRHKENFAYIGPKFGDLVQRWVERGNDPRRIEAVMDVGSAGVSCEFIK